ncbi:hypothetical protein L6V77_18500 [Myxococcota bacterium]|nr:hypothetical protein [Myxococcota bacterium]
MRPAIATVVLASCLARATSPALALSVVPLRPAEVAALSADVVIARVVRTGVAPGVGGAQVEHLRLDVLERWKGASWPARETGPVTVDWWVGPADVPRVRDGEVYLVFLPARSPGAAPLLPATVGGARGLFRAVRGAAGWSFFDLDGRPVLGVDAHAVRLGPRPGGTAAGGPSARPRAGGGVELRPRSLSGAVAGVPSTDVAAAWRSLVSGSR